MKKHLFFLGLLFFYITIFFSPNKLIYFGAYFISTIFFYLFSKNIRESLMYSLVLSLFSDVSLAASLFLMEPKELNLGSGWWVSPMTMVILILLPLSFRKPIKKIHKADIIILLFFIWGILSFITYPFKNVLYGVLRTGEVLLAYYLLRIYLTKKNLINIYYIIISILIFQSIIGSLQFLLQRNLGLLIESVRFLHPFGIIAVEKKNLFRITGTFGHTNMYAAVIISLLPFLFTNKNWLMNLIILASLINLFFTYSRSGWFIGFSLFGYLYLKFFFSNWKKSDIKKKLIPIFTFIILFILLLPSFISRLRTFPQAFESQGSFSFRIKLIQEGWSIIRQYPLFGVGVNRFQQVASANAITDVFRLPEFSAYRKIHNIFAEVAAEIGIPGAFFFVLFLFFAIKNYCRLEENQRVEKAAFLGLIGLILISSFHPFFQTSQFRLFFLLAAIILI